MDGGGLGRLEVDRRLPLGPDVGEEVVSPYLWSRGIKQLDVVALTHAHHDHLDGLHSVIAEFSAWANCGLGAMRRRRHFRALLAEARTRGVRIVHEIQGRDFDWDGVKGECAVAGGCVCGGRSVERRFAGDAHQRWRMQFSAAGRHRAESGKRNGGRARAAGGRFSEGAAPRQQDIFDG